MTVKPIPDGFHTVTPFLVVEEAPKLIDFLVAAFAAEETTRLTDADGKIVYASVKIGDAMVMLSEAKPDFPALKTMQHLYVEDVDTSYQTALEAGGQPIREPMNELYGDRACGVYGPCGQIWWIATQIEDLSPEEVQARLHKQDGQPASEH